MTVVEQDPEVTAILDATLLQGLAFIEDLARENHLHLVLLDSFVLTRQLVVGDFDDVTDSSRLVELENELVLDVFHLAQNSD